MGRKTKLIEGNVTIIISLEVILIAKIKETFV